MSENAKPQDGAPESAPQKIFPRCRGDVVQDYVSVEGYLMPCCWLSDTHHIDEYYSLFADCLDEMSVNRRPLSEILADPRLRRFDESWASATPLKACRHFCGKPLELDHHELRGRDKMGDVF